MDHGIDLDHVAAMKRREDAEFESAHPRSRELRARGRRSMPLGVPLSWMDFLYEHPVFVEAAEGSHFTDVDGYRYLDMGLAITVASSGHTPGPVIESVIRRMERGIQFGLPTEDSIEVSEELCRRWGLPKWQYQLTSTQAVTDAIHLARMKSKRERIVVFEGKYQGHLAELLAVEGPEGRTEPEYLGVTDHDVARTTVVAWNDLEAVERALEQDDVALVLAEPVLSNSGIVFPSQGFHDGVRRLSEEHGTLLALDETQTLPMAFGGLVRDWGLDPDLVILGKSLGGGVPVAALGMTEAVAALIDRDHEAYEVSGDAVDEPAIGGTLFGNALSMAAARAALSEVWTEPTYDRTRGLARQIASGIETAIRGRGRDWNVYAIGNRAGYRFAPDPPQDNRDAAEFDVPAVRHLQRVFMANRGIWEFGWWGGPAVSAQTDEADIDAYLGVFDGFIGELLA